MVMQRLVRVFGGDPHKREIEKLSLVVEQINQFEERYEALSNDALTNKTSEFKDRLASGETLDDLCRKPSRQSAKPVNAPLECAIMTFR